MPLRYRLYFGMVVLIWRLLQVFRFKKSERFYLTTTQAQQPWTLICGMRSRDGRWVHNAEFWYPHGLYTYKAESQDGEVPGFEYTNHYPVTWRNTVGFLLSVEIELRSKELHMPAVIVGVLFAGFWLGLITLLFWVGGMSVEYTLETWLSYFQQRAVDLPFLPCGLLGIFTFWFFIIAALFTWLISGAI